MDLVKDGERSKSLSKLDTTTLWNLIDTSKRKDSKFFELCKNLRILYKSGTVNELADLDEKDKVVVNLAHGHIGAMLPTLFFKQPTVKAAPTAPHHEGKEKTWESLINNTYKKVGLKAEAKKVVKDALVYPEGWMKILSNAPIGEQEGENVETGKRGEVPWMSKGAPVYARVSPLQTIVDYRSINRDLDNARFVCFVYAKDMDELKADSRYKIPDNIEKGKTYTGDNKLSISNGWIDPFVQEGEFGQEIASSDQDNYVFVYECWVHQIVGMKLKRHLVCLLAGKDGLMSDTPIRFDTWENVLGSQVKSYPFERLVFHDIPDSLPNSELGVWSSIHGAINWLTSRLVNLVEAEKPIYEYNKQNVDNDEQFRADFHSSRSSRILVAVKEVGKTVSGVSNHTTPRDNYQLMNTLQEAARQVGGVSENRQGGSGIRTATEASNVESGQQIKTLEKVDRVTEFFTNVTYKTIDVIRSIVQKDGDTSFVFNVGGDTGAVEWLNFDQNTVGWTPEISIEVNSFNKATREVDVQRAMMALNTGAQIAPLVPSIRMDLLYKDLLKALEVSGIAEKVDSKQDHMLLQVVELAQLVTGGAATVDISHDHAAHIQVLQMVLNSPEFASVLDENPAAYGGIVQHMQEHEEMLAQASEGMKKITGNNPFDTNVQGQSPANQARQDTAIDRETSKAGTGGQF